ncbi:unnamed protein product [Amoebophrya sp. A25]|nr:unnamed protein product [Amoebophrya sp. A25]|eukprot:GSA25T00007525001.1
MPDFFSSRIQCTGFVADEHWTRAVSSKVDAEFVKSEDAKALYAWLDADEEGNKTMQVHVISAKKTAEGVPLDNIPTDIVSGGVSDFSYFLKREHDPSKDLQTTVHSSHIRGDLVQGLLHNMNSMFVPMSRLNHGWPENVQKEFITQMQKFMSSVTEMAYQAKGATVLYVPPDDLSNVDAVAKDKNIVPRLEASLIHWTRQIKEVTSSQEQSGGNEGQESAGPLDEIDFWRARDLDLSRLAQQLQSDDLQRVLEVLEAAKSSYLNQFRALEKDIQEGSREARENLGFLNLLKEPATELCGLTVVQIPKILPELLNIVRFIWTVSDTYNTSDRISNLLRTISNEIIRRCQHSVDVERILNPGATKEKSREEDVRETMVLLEQCVECGRKWKEEYHLTCAAIRKNEPADRHWNFSEGTIFAQADAFVQRCCDLLEIAEEQLQFAGFSTRENITDSDNLGDHDNLDKIQDLGSLVNPTLPKFGGAKAGEIIRSLFEIETSFLKQVKKLHDVDYNVLDVKSMRWGEDFGGFKNQMKDLEVMYTNVISSAFESVSTVSQCVHVFDSFYLLCKRERIKSFLEKKASEVGGFLISEIGNVKREFERFRKNSGGILLVHPPYSGVAMWARGLMLRISRQYEELGSLCYMPQGSVRTETVRTEYANMMAMLESFCSTTFHDWISHELGTDEDELAEKLKTPLLCRVPLPPGQQGGFGSLLESNFDKNLLRIFNETYYWEKIQGSGIVVPFHAHDISTTFRDPLRITREHVMRVVREYNSIILALAPEERRLFAHHIKSMDRKIGPGIQKYTWTSHGVKEFFVRDALKECNKCSDFVSQYKDNIGRIRQVTRNKFASATLILIERKHIHTDSEFRMIQDQHREKIKAQFREAHSQIVDIMLATYVFFESHPPDIQQQWRIFVDKIDRLLEDALKKATKTSLQDLSRTLNGDSKSEPLALFRVHAILDAWKMDFNPTMNQLKELLQTVCRDTTMTLQEVPRLWDHLNAEKAKRDTKKKAELEELGDLAGANAITINYVPPPPGTKKATFFEAISKDDECCIRYVKEVLKGFNACSVKLGERLNWWNSNYQPIVSQDKDAFIRRYARTERPLSVAGQDIQRYKEVQMDIQQEDTKTVIGFLETDFSLLKAALTEHCVEWQKKLTGLLNENALRDMDALYKYFADTSVIVLHPPENLNELRDGFQLLTKSQNILEDTRDRIEPIEAMYAKLTEFDVAVSEEETARKNNLRAAFEEFCDQLGQSETIMGKAKKTMKAAFEGESAAFKQSVKDLKKTLQQLCPYSVETKDGLLSNDAAFAIIEDFKEQVANKRAIEEDHGPKLDLFGIEKSEYPELEACERDLELLTTIWTLKQDYDVDFFQKNQTAPFTDINVEYLDETAGATQKKVMRLKKDMQFWSVWQFLKGSIDTFRSTMPLIENLRHDSMRMRHWEEIMKEVGQTFDPYGSDFTLQTVFDLNLLAYSDLVSRLADEARKEAKIEIGVRDIESTWKSMELVIGEHKQVYYKLKPTEEMNMALEEHILALSSFKSSPFAIPFAQAIEYWEATLATISEVQEQIQIVQKSWMYLENIFVGSEDIRPHLPQESIMFDEVSDNFTTMLGRMYQDPVAVRCCLVPGLYDMLEKDSGKLEKIQKSLDDYLEKKRQLFPRFYFLSNDDLLEILGQAKDPEAVQKHLKKCFEGIKSLDLVAPSAKDLKSSGGTKAWEAIGMNSPDGEKVKFIKPVPLDPPVEGWLVVVERRMRESLRKVLNTTHVANITKNAMKKEKWVKEFPGQLLITSGQIAWTTDCENALALIEKGKKNAMKLLKKSQTKYIGKMTDMIRKPLNRVERGKLVALITIEVHARDVQAKLVETKTDNPRAFMWMQQLRFALKDLPDEAPGNAHCYVLQTNTNSPYGYEYQGNNGRLVVTPMTDRCYMTLTTAMHLKRGGAPQGPAGTGKTESTKDLGKGMAKYVIVFNCSDGLDYKSLGRMFSGLAQSGSWGCFDEFNRIDVEVLSVVAVQILTLQAALRQEVTQFLFEERMIKLDRGCAVFITMNPGYAGRSELPDNLKSLFRPVAMMLPDFAMIIEIMLVAEGYKDFKPLAKKMVSLYDMMKQQMSKQDHYDFGLRNIKSVLNCAGALKRSEPDSPEAQLLMRAINDMNAPKWVSQDLPLYWALMSDIFPGQDLPDPDYGSLEDYIRSCLRANGYQETSHIIKKTISTYETKMTRHGNMLVGNTLGGKTVAWKTLQEAKCNLKADKIEGFEKVLSYILNPKSVTMDQLYGAYDLSTMEWMDGVLSSLMRIMCQDEKADEKWLLLDGPVDTLWIESMNTVLDDNKVLTLINGDRISMPGTVRLLFEVQDLKVASPATVSRAGMVYFDTLDMGYMAPYQSWSAVTYKDNEEKRNYMQELGDKWFPSLLNVRRNASYAQTVPISENMAVKNFANIYTCFARKLDTLLNGLPEDKGGAPGGVAKDGTEPPMTAKQKEIFERMFAFCCVWSLGASATEKSRKQFDEAMRSVESRIMPSNQTVYEYYLNFEKHGELDLWEARLPQPFYRPPEGAPFHRILVPTVDTIRNGVIIRELTVNNFHYITTGMTGTGKTVALQAVIANDLDEQTWTSLNINMSAQTSAAAVQEIIEGKVEKRIKNKFGPPGNKKMLLFVDDLNMPRKDTFGSQPPLELLRQWMDYGHWYDLSKQTMRIILDMQLGAAMGPPGGGRAAISERFQSCCHLLNFANPADAQVKRIYMTLAQHKLHAFKDDVKNLAENLVGASIDLYGVMVDKMLPTPAKCHYLFNLRDVSKIFQGLYMAEPGLVQDKETIVRMWWHEASRAFGDRLISMADRDQFDQFGDSVMENRLSSRIGDVEMAPDGKKKQKLIFAHIDMANTDAENPDYTQISDRVALKQFANIKLDDYNEMMKKKPLSLVMFQDAIEHMCKILRVLKLPRGNALLVGVGGSGRHCQTRLACFVADYECFNIEIDKSYRHQSFRDDLKKIYDKTGVKRAPTCFLYSDTEIITESFLEDVSNILSSGEVPNLFANDELGTVLQACEKAAKAELGLRNVTPEQLYGFFIGCVRENLHVVFCMSPIGSGFRNYCRMYPSLVSCTTVNWFLTWPPEALTEVALKFLSEGEDPVDPKIAEPLAIVFGLSHTAVIEASDRVLAEMKRNNYVTPTNYLELVSGYVKTLREKQAFVGGAADKLRNGLHKLSEARVQVEELAVELEVKSDIVARKQKECQELLIVITEKRMAADEQQKQVEEDSARIEKEAADTKVLAEDAQRDLAKAMPAMEAALDALAKLDKKSISEVKAYAKPPEMVMKTMNAVMTVMDKQANWASAKVELNDTRFLDKLKEFDKDHIPNTTLKKMDKYIKDPTFTPAQVAKVSLAAGALCQWVHAMNIYAAVAREVEPKRLKLRLAQTALEKKLEFLENAKRQLAEVQRTVQELKDLYENSTREKEEITQTAEDLKIKAERADKLVNGLAGEKIRWEESVKKLDIDIGNLYGDVAIAAAFLSYAGPFGAKYRDALVSEKWMAPVSEYEIPVTPGFNFVDFLADPAAVRTWNVQGLPTDGFSTENGILVTRGSRWALMIDPQNQGNKWIRKMEEPQGLKVFDPNTTGFMRTLERAIEFGTPCMMENVKEELDPSLEPVLAKQIINQGGSLSIKIGENTLDYNINFKFYLTTKLSNPHYTPEVSTKTTIVNFIVVVEGLTDQMLGIVVGKEEARLEKDRTELVVKVAMGKNRLVELENELLRLLSEAKGSLLDDLNLINTLQESKTISESVTEQLRVAVTTMAKIDAARENYRPCGLRAAILYFVLNDLVTVDPMYQFSLEAYEKLFVMSIERSADKGGGASNVEDRIEILNAYHSLAVYKYACRGLFERHKLMLSLHIASKVLKSMEEDWNDTEYAFFLRGGQVMDRSTQPSNAAPEWITPAMWDNITELDTNVPAFSGFQRSLEQSLREWKKWFSMGEPEIESLPGEWDAKLGPLQKMVVVRCLRLDRVLPAISVFVSVKLDSKFVEPPPFDLATVYEESQADVPLLFVLTPGMDPTPLLIALANQRNFQWSTISLGQGQAPKATKLTLDAAKSGSWALLANCHLSASWLPGLEKLFEKVVEDKPHPNFRLWLSSSPTKVFPIALLQKCIKMVTEPPKGLRANCNRLVQNMDPQQYNRVKEAFKYRRLYFSLVWFHAILLERKKFRTLGWNSPYDFNDSDFDMCENILAMYLDEYPTEVQWDAMKYLIAEANYGGRVTQATDNRVLRAYVNDFFCPEAIQNNKFYLSSLTTYYIPEDNTLQAYGTMIKDWPMAESPEAFGQHVNAEISSALQESEDTLIILAGMQSDTGGGGQGKTKTKDEMVFDQTKTLLDQLPDDVDWDEVAKFNEKDNSPYKVVLLQEIERYNLLLVKVRANLKELQKGIQGLVVISEEQELVFNALFEGRIPSAWTFAYPSAKPLSSWMPDLRERITCFVRWGLEEMPMVFWLASFTYPTGFLTACLQYSARKNTIAVDQLAFDFLAQPTPDPSQITQAPKEGAYVRSLIIEGAKWDYENMSLADAEPMQLFSGMPIIMFKPVVKKKAAGGDIYQCPLYTYPDRVGSPTRASFQLYIELKSGAYDPGFWIKRGTAMLLSTA